jgi:hypothetical protein
MNSLTDTPETLRALINNELHTVRNIYYSVLLTTCVFEQLKKANYRGSRKEFTRARMHEPIWLDKNIYGPIPA